MAPSFSLPFRPKESKRTLSVWWEEKGERNPSASERRADKFSGPLSYVFIHT